jgi:hypothetical protein
MWGRRALIAALLAVLVLGRPASVSSAELAPAAVRVLFLGNSITYVGNLPAVFASLCGASGHKCLVEMIVKGGAALSDRAIDGSLDRPDVAHRFDYVILQERGGDLIDLPDETARKSAESAAESLVLAARRLGMKPILLGTYQPWPASDPLVAAESNLSAKLKLPHLAVSNYLECGKRENGSLRWFYSDGMHPGSDLTLMMAMALHREIFGSYPPAVPISVRAPIYGASSGLTSESFASAQALRPGTPTSIDYDTATLQSVLGILEAKCPKT